MIKNIFTITALAVIVVACGYIQTGSSTYLERSLGITALDKPTYKMTINGSFVKKERLSITTEIGSPIETTIALKLSAPTSVDLSEKDLKIHLNAGESKLITVYATPQRRGFFGVDTQATPNNNWGDLPEFSRSVFFNVIANTDVQTANITGSPSGVMTTTAYVNSLPEATPNLYQQQEKDRIEGTDNAILDAKVTNFTYQVGLPNNKPSTGPIKTITTTEDYVMSYLPNTGSGQPEPGELEGTKPIGVHSKSGDPKLNAQNFLCGGEHASTVQININSPNYTGTNGYGGYSLKNIRVRVYDNNGNWNAQIADGYTNSTGNFDFIKPNCDTSSWWDWSPPDIYYVITGETNNGLQTNVSRVFWTTAGFSTGTDWEDTTASKQIGIYAPEAIHTRVLFSSHVMIQKAREVNDLAGAHTASTFPVRVHEFYSTFVPVGVIFLGNAYNTTYESGLDTDPNGYADPYMIYHEFGHNIMWAMRDRSNYLNIFYHPTLPVSSPGYEDEQCIAAGLNGTQIDPIIGLINMIQCFATAYQHNGDSLYDEKLAWSEGFANYFDNIALLYLYKKDNEVAYKNYLLGNRGLPRVFCGLTTVVGCSAQNGTKNETRVGTFLTRYTIEVLAGFSPPSSAAAYGTWINSLTLANTQAILTQYGRVRDATVLNKGSLMGLNNLWSGMYNLIGAVDKTPAMKTKICLIAKESEVLDVNTPLPCNSDGTAKP